MLIPLGDYILVEVKKQNTGGLILPDGSDSEESQEGIVVCVGPGLIDKETGARTEMFVTEIFL